MGGPINNELAGVGGKIKQFQAGPSNILGAAFQVIPTDTWTIVEWPAILRNVIGWGIDGNGEKIIIPDTSPQKGWLDVKAAVAWQDFVSGTTTELSSHRRKIRIILYYGDAPGNAFGRNVYAEDEKHWVATCAKGETGKNAVQMMTASSMIFIDPTLSGARIWVEVFQNSGSDVRIQQQGGEAGPDGAGILNAAAPLLSAYQISRG